MANLQISEKLAERLQRFAEQEQRPVEAILESMIDYYAPISSIPDDVEDKTAYLAAMREVRPKIYAIAREYWQRTGDHERLALTDAELDQQFWLIDHEGIPRLKSEQDTVEIPPDPIDDLIGMIDSDVTDA